MPDTWTVLKNSSSLVIGDAWEHLNNQSGTSGYSGIVLLDGLDIDIRYLNYELLIENNQFDILINDIDYDVEIRDGLTVEINEELFNIEVD